MTPNFPDITIRRAEDCIWIEAGDARIPLRFEFATRFAEILEYMASPPGRFIRPTDRQIDQILEAQDRT